MTVDWKINEVVPAFFVSDLDLAKEFYECLGFTEAWRWPRDLMTFLGMKRGHCSITLKTETMARSGELYLVVDDIDACHRSVIEATPWEVARRVVEADTFEGNIVEASLAPPSAPVLQAHRHEDFVVVDPWGNRLIFSSECR